MRRSAAQAVIGHLKDFFNSKREVVDAWRRDFLPRLMSGVVQSEGLVITEIVRNAFRTEDEFVAGYKAFSRHLNSPVWDRHERRLQEAVEREWGRRVREMTPVVVDEGDLAKPYAKKMEHLGWILDGDTKAVTPGYGCFESYAVETPEAPHPLVNFVYSLNREETPSRQHARRIGYARITEATQGRGVVVADRGFDGDDNFQDLNDHNLRWLIRLVGNRELRDASGESLGIVEDFVATWRLNHVMKAPGAWKDGEELGVWVAYDFMEVRLPAVKGRYWLIAVRRCMAPAEGGMYLLTTVPILQATDAERMIAYYHHRWRVEDSIRVVKSALGMEGVRALNFRALRRLVMTCYWVMGILSQLRVRLTARQLQVLTHRGGFFRHRIPRLLHYRLLAGIQWVIEKSGVT